MSRPRVRSVIVSLCWTALFAVATALLAGFGSGLLFAAQVRAGGNPAADAGLINTVGLVWAIAPLLGLALGAFLCAFGWLPGTKLADPKPVDPA